MRVAKSGDALEPVRSLRIAQLPKRYSKSSMHDLAKKNPSLSGSTVRFQRAC